MKKVIYNKYGTIENLQLVEVEIPSIKPTQLLIKVKAVSINPIDIQKVEGNLKIITGSKFPKGIGVDFSGIVEEIGDSNTSFKIGDEVFGALNAMKGEALAEYIVVQEQNIFKKPSNISFEKSAAMVTTGIAASYLLENSNLNYGDEVIINGASGGVGLIALQMALQKGLKVTAVASGQGLEFIQKFKPQRIIDFTNENVLNIDGKYDAWFEISTLTSYNKAKHLLKKQSSFISLKPDPISMISAFFNNLISEKKHKVIIASPTQKHYRDISHWVTEKGIEIIISKNFQMSDFKEAYRFVKKGGVIGKVVITV